MFGYLNFLASFHFREMMLVIHWVWNGLFDYTSKLKKTPISPDEILYIKILIIWKFISVWNRIRVTIFMKLWYRQIAMKWDLLEGGASLNPLQEKLVFEAASRSPWVSVILMKEVSLQYIFFVL